MPDGPSDSDQDLVGKFEEALAHHEEITREDMQKAILNYEAALSLYKENRKMRSKVIIARGYLRAAEARRLEKEFNAENGSDSHDPVSRFLEIVISVVSKPKEGKAFLADLDELHDYWKEKYGSRSAKGIYRLQLARAVLSFIFAPAGRLLGALVGRRISGG